MLERSPNPPFPRTHGRCSSHGTHRNTRTEDARLNTQVFVQPYQREARSSIPPLPRVRSATPPLPRTHVWCSSHGTHRNTRTEDARLNTRVCAALSAVHASRLVCRETLTHATGATVTPALQGKVPPYLPQRDCIAEALDLGCAEGSHRSFLFNLALKPAIAPEETEYI